MHGRGFQLGVPGSGPETYTIPTVRIYLLSAVAAVAAILPAQTTRPDPKEIPVPPIQTSMHAMPGVNQLTDRPEMPDVLTLNSGHKITTAAQWTKRRAEMREILEYYAVGQAPPPPGNVKGRVLGSQVLMNGKANYKLMELTFGPKESLCLDVGIFTPPGGGPVPAVISPAGSPPGSPVRMHLPPGGNQGTGQDALLVVAPDTPDAGAFGHKGCQVVVTRAPENNGAAAAEKIAASNPALAHGFAYVTFNNSDCGTDSTLRRPDGSWAFRHEDLFEAYPNYDWGLLRAWAWCESRIVDYLQTDPSIDKTKLIVTGVSRTGKAALIAGAFDDRFAMIAPVASSGGGTPAYRFSGADRGGKEGLTEMMRKYPNWFSPHLHEFWGQPDKLPFDEHWFIALAAPRPFIALEGTHDQNVNFNGVRQSFLAAQSAFNLTKAPDRLGISWAERPHGMVQGDWDALLAFADKFLLGKQIDRRFSEFPSE